MTTDSGRLFMQTAIQLEELADADAARVLELLPSGTDPGRFAEKMGVLTASARLRVQAQVKPTRTKQTTKKKTKKTRKTARKSDGKVRSTSDGKVRSTSDGKVRRKTPARGTTATKDRKTPSKGSLPARRSTTRRQPQRKSVLPLVGVALLLGGGIGVGAVVAFGNKPAEAEPQLSKADPRPVVVPESPAPEPVGETPAQAFTKEREARQAIKRKADARAIRTAQAMVAKLKQRERERTALTVLDELIADRGPFKEARAARLALLRHCEQVVTQKARRAERLVDAGDLEGALLLLTRLSKRLPTQTQPRIDTLVATLKARAAAQPAPVAVAKAPEQKEFEAKPVAKAPEPEDETEETEEDEEGEDWKPGSSAPKTPVKPKAKQPAVDTTSPLAAAVKERVSVRHTLRADGTLSVIYPLQEAGDLIDFKARGFDTFDVNEMVGMRESQASSMGLEVGAGSQRLGRMAHSIHFDGDFSIEAELWLSSASGRTLLVFMLGKKHGVSFGQQIVKVSKSGRLKRLSRRPADPTVFREERRVKVKFDYVDGTLTVRCNGRKTAVKRFTKGELKGPFGLIARDVRLQITQLKIDAKVDPTKL